MAIQTECANLRSGGVKLTGFGSSISKESRNGRTLYRLEYRDPDKRRRKIRLGSLSKRDAEAIAAKIQSIVSAAIAGNDLPSSTAEWLSKIGDDLHAKLAEQGLCKARAQYSLGEWITQYIAQHTATGVGFYCSRNLEQCQRLLELFFDKDKPLKSVLPIDAQGFRNWLVEQNYAQATVSQNIKRAKQFFSAAVKAEVIAKSPFVDVVAGSQVNEDRSVYVSVETIERAIAMAPDAQWRLIIALSRYAGLRCPSETLSLKWDDVDFVKGTMTITSGKTAKRVVPILPELRPYLADAYDAESDRCISRYRVSNSNLRKMFLEILAKAKITPWPRLFHNLRGSLETDLFNRFPAHTVVSWLGNSEAVALKHYLKVTPQHLSDAVGGVGQGVGTSLAESTPLAGNERKQIPDFPEGNEKALIAEGTSIHMG